VALPFWRTSVAYSLTRQISPSLTVIASLDWNATRPSPPCTVTWYWMNAVQPSTRMRSLWTMSSPASWGRQART
jgi:hypothetical protein